MTVDRAAGIVYLSIVGGIDMQATLQFGLGVRALGAAQRTSFVELTIILAIDGLHAKDHDNEENNNYGT